MSERGRAAWTSPLVLGLIALAVAASGAVGFVAGRRTAPLGISGVGSASPLPSASSPPAKPGLALCGGGLLCQLPFSAPLPVLPGELVVAFHETKLEDSGRITIEGRVRVAGDIGVDEIEQEAIVFDAAHAEIGRDVVRLHGSYDPPLLPGDSGTFLASIPVTAMPASLEWGPPKLKRVEHPPKTEGTLVPIALPPGVDPSTKLEVRIRSRESSSALHVHGVFTVANTGTTTLSALKIHISSKLSLKWSDDKEIVRQYGSPLAPGERRAFAYNFFDVAEDAGGGDVFVITTLR